MYLVQLILVLFIYEAHSVKVKDIIDKKVYYNLSEARELFDDYIEYFNKTYESKDEYEERLEIFTNRLALFNHHNTLSDGIFGLSIHTDLKDEELNMGGGFVPDPETSAPANNTDELSVPMQLQPYFSWIDLNAVTLVKNQGLCGSCWAFAAVGAIEGLYARTHPSNQPPIEFSEQEVLDCSQGGNCTSGNPFYAMMAMAQNFGMMSRADYSYVGYKQQCLYDPYKVRFRFSKAFILSPRTEEELQQMLVQYGPLTAIIRTNEQVFKNYPGGIATADTLQCDLRDYVPHAVLIVGYNTNAVIPYWIIKNSHGQEWGGNNRGYLYLRMGFNDCGILQRQIGAVM